MKVAYVCTDPGVPVFGLKGGSIHAQSVVRALQSRGAEVVLFARRLGGGHPIGLEAIPVRQLSKAPSGQDASRERFLLEANAELRGLLAAERGLDLIYERHSLFSYAAMEHARDAGIPGLLEVNAPLIEEQQRFRSLTLVTEAEAADARCFGAAGAVLAVSRPLAERVARETAARGRVHVVPNGVDVSRFGPRVEPTLPRPAGEVTIGFVGSLRPWHGVEQLVEAFLRLRRTTDGVRLLIVGDGPMREQLEASSAPAADSVVMTGAVAPAQVPGLLASMDIAVAPYPRIEEFYFSPLKLFEYMAAGVAIAASAAGQVGEVVEDDRTGLLYEPGDADGLVSVLRRLIADPALRARLGSRARETACLRHGWGFVAGKILELAGELREAAV